jgi:uncharacterized membrane protein YhhN
VYVFKPLTMLIVLALAVQPGVGTSAHYRWLVVAGLVFSLMGDVALMLPSDRFVEGLSSFLIAHVLYLAAFASDAGLTTAPLGLLAFAGGVALVYAGLRPHLGRARIPVVVYMVAIALMAWQALARWLALDQFGALLACIGAVLFVLSDTALAWNRFRRPFAAAQAVVLGTYFTAQWLIALSIGVGEAMAGGGVR